MMAKEKGYCAKEAVLKEMLDAKAELDRVEQMFNFASDEYFEIANLELTVAKMRYELVAKKIKMIFSPIGG